MFHTALLSTDQSLLERQCTGLLCTITLLILKGSVCTSFNTSVYAHIPAYTTGMYISNTGLVLWIYIHTYVHVRMYIYIRIHHHCVYVIVHTGVQEGAGGGAQERTSSFRGKAQPANEAQAEGTYVCTPCLASCWV